MRELDVREPVRVVRSGAGGRPARPVCSGAARRSAAERAAARWSGVPEVPEVAEVSAAAEVPAVPGGVPAQAPGRPDDRTLRGAVTRHPAGRARRAVPGALVGDPGAGAASSRELPVREVPVRELPGRPVPGRQVPGRDVPGVGRSGVGGSGRAVSGPAVPVGERVTRAVAGVPAPRAARPAAGRCVAPARRRTRLRAPSRGARLLAGAAAVVCSATVVVLLGLVADAAAAGNAESGAPAGVVVAEQTVR